jgi:hypothetical protein
MIDDEQCARDKAYDLLHLGGVHWQSPNLMGFQISSPDARLSTTSPAAMFPLSSSLLTRFRQVPSCARMPLAHALQPLPFWAVNLPFKFAAA